MFCLTGTFFSEIFPPFFRHWRNHCGSENSLLYKSHYLGSSRDRGTPVSISNTAVKPVFANDTAALTVVK